MEMVKRVLLGDVGEESRSWLAISLEKEADIQVVGQTGDGAELVRMVKELEPDAVVMEMVLTGMDGLEVLDQLSKVEHRPKVLILSSYIRGNMVQAAAEKGADYYITKPCRVEAVCERIRQVTAGERSGQGKGESNVDLETQVKIGRAHV